MAQQRRPEPDEVIDAVPAPPASPAAPTSQLAAHVTQTAEQAVELEPGLSYDEEFGFELDDAPAPGAAAADDDGPTPDDIERIRRIRKPMGEFSQKLALPKRRGYQRHWFNNKAGRIGEARDAGWEFVRGTDGKPLKRVVGTAKEGGAIVAYAMEIPEIFWMEDMARKHAEAKSRMDALKQNPFSSVRGNESARPEDAQKFYSPGGSAPLQINGGGNG